MSWALLDDDFPHHPKVQISGNAAGWLFVCGLCYCRKYHTEGFIILNAVQGLGFIGSCRKALEALVAAGLWDRVEGGYQIHDYAVLYPRDAEEKDEKSDRSRARAESGRLGGIASAARRAERPVKWTVAPDSEHSPYEASKPPSKEASKPQANGQAKVNPIGSGTGSVPDLVPSFSEEKKDPPRLDLWVRELQQDYPQQRVTAGHLTEKAFCDAIFGESDGPASAWLRMRANLENQKRGYEWRVKRMVPKLENWLRLGLWKQRHDETAPDLNPKTAGTLGAAADIMREGE